MEPVFGYNFPAIRGIQAKREYFVSMCPLRLIPKLFSFDEEGELVPELRAQRILNRARVPEIARYIVDNRGTYVFSALTASIDGKDGRVEFSSFSPSGHGSHIGTLSVPMDAKFIINDGQHRRAAIEQALRDNPDLGDETIAVVFFLDKGLSRCQQMFADLNRHAIRPSKSLGVLYDHRDDMAHLARLVVMRSPCFHDIVEMERSSLSARSRRLLTLSSIYTATGELLDAIKLADQDHAASVAIEFWEEVAQQFPDWQLVREKKVSAGDIRADYLHTHGIVLQALGMVGNHLLREHSGDWKKRLKGLRKIDWSRKNGALWEGRATVGGKVVKGRTNVLLASAAIKSYLRLELTPEERTLEDTLNRSRNGSRSTEPAPISV